MDIYDFINLNNDCWCTVFTVFDCNTEECVNIDGKTLFEATELQYSEYANYEICSMDMWIDDEKRIHIEFNIEVEEDD